MRYFIVALVLALSFRAEFVSGAPQGAKSQKDLLGDAINAAAANAEDPDALRAQVGAALAQFAAQKVNTKDPKAVNAYFAGIQDEDVANVIRKLIQLKLIGDVGKPPAKPVSPTAPGDPVVQSPTAVPPDPTNNQFGSGQIAATPVLPPNWQLGIDIGQQQVQAHPDSPQPKVDLGSMYYAAHDYGAAYNLFNSAVSKGDQDPSMLAMMGNSAYQLGDYKTAAAAAQQILESDPSNKDALALKHLSEFQVPTVHLPSALGELAAGRSPESMPGGNALPTGAAAHGSSFFGIGSMPPAGMTAEQAIAAAKQAAEPGSDAPARSRQFTMDAANAMRQRDYPTSYQLATQAVNLNPENAQALNYRAMSSSQMRHYAEAVQDASAALGLAPGNPAALHTRSWAFSKEGKYKEGLADAVAASAAEPSNAFLYQDKAFALAGLGDHPGTIDALAHSAALDQRFKARYERAVQLPQDSDMTLLFDDGSAGAAAVAVAPPAPGERQRRFLRLAILSAVGGLLIALGVLHVVSASWRERMRMTVRRVLGGSGAVAADSTVVLDSPSAGAFWTQYRLVKEIGLGGMGVVYEAMDLSLERRVAVKKMRDEIRLDADDRRRFVNEARLVAQLHHPNIVDIYGIVEDGADVYLVFEFVEGRTLQDALKSGGPMELSRARGVIKEMAEAVAHAHERNVIHRDLKPSNVMQTPEGRIKVMDFGVARQAKDAMTRRSMTNSIAGTPPYMAPEQEQGNVRKESDVYALGVCLYEMTTGQLPFSGYGAAMLLNKLNGKLIPPTHRVPSLPSGFDAVIAKALAPDPDNRYRTPAELVAALDALLTTAA
jgi:tetratricopeptide (TPR) repeat protein